MSLSLFPLVPSKNKDLKNEVMTVFIDKCPVMYKWQWYIQNKWRTLIYISHNNKTTKQNQFKKNEANEANFAQTFLSCFYFIFSEHFNEVFRPTTRTVLAGKTSSSWFSLLFLVVLDMPEPPASIHLYTVQLQFTTLRPGRGNWWNMHLKTVHCLHQPGHFRINWINTWFEHLLRRMLIK